MMERGQKELHEQFNVQAKTISGEELLDRIYKGESLPQDERFMPIEKGGVFKYLNLSELTGLQGVRNKHFPTVESNGEIIGLAELEESPYEENSLFIKFVSVDPNFQDQGYGSKLIEEIFKFAKENDYSLQSSMYSDDGFTKLKPKLNELSEKYEVKFIDTDNKIET